MCAKVFKTNIIGTYPSLCDDSKYNVYNFTAVRIRLSTFLCCLFRIIAMAFRVSRV